MAGIEKKSSMVAPWWAKGRGESGGDERDGRDERGFRRLGALVVLLAVVGAGVWWWMASGTGDARRETRGTAAGEGVVNADGSEAGKVAKGETGDKETKRQGGTRDARLETRGTAAGDGFAKADGLAADDEAKADGLVAGDEAKAGKPPQIKFKTSTELYLAMATPSEPGYGVPPVPIPEGEDFSQDVKKALDNVIVAEEGDDEHTIQVKLNVTDQKEELRTLLKEGWTMPQYVKALREKLLDDNDFMAECHQIEERVHDDATVSDEEYARIRGELNERLRAKGLPELPERAEETEEKSGATGAGKEKR